MRVSLKWLSEFVEVPSSVPELVDRLDMTGTAVEAVHALGESFDNIVTGQITDKVRHPNADKLWVTTVDVGDGTPRTIVCGAQNFEVGDKVVVALPGAVLPGDFEIKKSKLRGVVSEGMNCSARELGLGNDHDGIMILPADAPIGVPFAEYQKLGDTVLELEVTPNRPDCLSMVGVAREIGAIFEKPVTMPEPPAVAESGESAADRVSVEIADPKLCPRYTARVIRGVKIGPSPQWLAERVAAAGARPINNIVDITNYVMFELGQPLHAFDLATLGADADGRVAITVRRAEAGETLRTLDGVDRELTPETLCICDPTGPVALAGVMGGEATEVSDTTVDILLESAAFDPESISRTSRRLGLVSEASLRFERTVDRTGCVAALDRAAALMAELADGEVCAGVVDEFPAQASSRVLGLRSLRLSAVIGEEIAQEEAADILRRLGCQVEVLPDLLDVTIPTFRPDLEREIDLVEEVLRIHGMESIAATLPAGRGRVGMLTREQKLRDRIGMLLRAAGLNETMTYSFTDPGDLERIGMTMPLDECEVQILNPMSGEQSVLRRTLLPGLLRSVSYNQRRGVEDVHLYEIGSVFWTAPGRKLPKERERMAGVLAGSWNRPQWNEPARPLDFFDGKGVLETVMRDLAASRFKVRACQRPWLQPGRAAEVLVSGDVIGWIGEVHPSVLERFECDAPVTAFELEIGRLIRSAREERTVQEPPRFPAVELDLAIVVDESITAEQLVQSVLSAGGKLLESARLFDVYRGKGIPEGKKSMALALTYRAPDRTLTAEEVDQTHERLVRKVVKATGGEVRGAS